MSDTGSHEDLIGRLFAAIDRMDTPAFLDCLGDDCRFRFGSAEAVSGRDAIGAAVDGFFGSIRALAHDVGQTVTAGNVLVAEGHVTYTRHDGSRLTLPFCNVFEIAGERIRGYRIYIDIAPLYAVT